MILHSLLFILYSTFCSGPQIPHTSNLITHNSPDTLRHEHVLKDVVITATNGTRSKSRVESVDLIGQGQLARAACCNLGESFTANPSVDVSYSDAATGARQIKLLGLSGTYVQMMTENIPNLRGASLPYSLGYVPGPWMQSIQVSKGASSVKNGYESITGQINIEFLKPQGVDGVRGNLYYDIDNKIEANADASIHLTDRLSTSLLMHFENRQTEHDGNHDGFMDMPRLRQYNLMHRWAYVAPGWISQLAMRILRDERTGGQTSHLKPHTSNLTPQTSHLQPYTTSVTTNRYEAWWKNGFPLLDGHNSSIALMLHGSWHDSWNTFGLRHYDVSQRNLYAQLMYETDITPSHNISLGASLNHDYYAEELSISQLSTFNSSIFNLDELTPGIYAQYTYKLDDKLTVMPGIRWDHSSRYGGFLTPRLHIRYQPFSILTLRASAGKGYRSAHPLAENTTLLATGREIYIEPNLQMEEAINYGLSAALNIPVGGRNLELNAEYYYTHFIHQVVINYTEDLQPTTSISNLSFLNLHGRSYSHTLQVDATYPLFEGFSATAAFRLNDVRCTYDGILRQKPLTSRYKGLLTLSYKTPMELWHFDLTTQLNGGGYLYTSNLNSTIEAPSLHSPSLRERVGERPRAGGEAPTYPAYFQLQAQVTREFRHFSIYLGGENLTNYKISDPIRSPHAPWSQSFDATQIWGPVTGAMFYIGLRFKFEKL